MKPTAAQIAKVREKVRSTQIGNMLTAAVAEAAVDEHALTELGLYIENEASLYPLKLQILKGLKRKMDKNLYDAEQAKRLWKFWIDQGAKKYAQEFSNQGDERTIFSEETKRKLLDKMEVQYADEIKNGEHDHVKSALKELNLTVAAVDEGTQAELAAMFPDSADEIMTSWKLDANGTARFDADGGEWEVAESEEAAERIALERVRDDLDNEPEIFSKDFMRNYLTITDTDRRIMAADESDARVADMDDDEVIQRAELEDAFLEADESGDVARQEEILHKARAKVQEDIYDEIYEGLADPVHYFVAEQGIFTEEELMKQNFITIDREAAAKDAVAMDGWEHFLAGWDGNYQTLPSGAVYWRVN